MTWNGTLVDARTCYKSIINLSSQVVGNSLKFPEIPLSFLCSHFLQYFFNDLITNSAKACYLFCCSMMYN